MEHFWPSLPYHIPPSQGMRLWWDIFWWIFQIVTMTTIIVLLRTWALREDKDKDQIAEATAPGADSDVKM